MKRDSAIASLGRLAWTVTLTIGATLLVLGSAPALAAAPGGGHTAVASDGSDITVPEAARQRRGERGYRGTRLPLQHTPLESPA
jgi:hypothetical protein